MSYDPERAQSLSDSLVDFLNEQKGFTLLEKVYAVSGVLFAIGASAYDKSDVTYDAVFKDYKESPSWPAALMLVSHIPHELREIFVQEKRDPSVNVENWKKMRLFDE